MVSKSAWVPCALALAICSGSAASPAQVNDDVALASQAAQQCKDGDVSAAHASLTALLKKLEAKLGPGHDMVFTVRLNLSHLEHAQGNDARAKELEKPLGGASHGKPSSKLKRALRGLRVCAGLRNARRTEAPKLASEDQVNLARNMLNRGKYREALTMVKDALANPEQSGSPRNRMRLLQTLALTELQMGDAASALQAAGGAQKLARQLGASDTRIQLARLIAGSGDLEGATAELDAVEKSANTPALRAELAEARADLALRLGSPRVALVHLEGALADHQKTFGPNSASTAAVHHMIGDAHRITADFPAAKQAYDKAHRIRSKTLGPNHAETARTLNAIGVLQADLGDWKAADHSFASAQLKLEGALGSGHPEILTVRSNRALARWGARQDAGAAREYAEVVTALRKAWGETHPQAAAAVRNLARIEFDRGEIARAEALLERALAAQTQSLGPEHPSLAATRLALARLLARKGDLLGAAIDADKAIVVLVKARGAEHPVVIRARTLRAQIALALGDEQTAFDQAQQASTALAHYTRYTFGAISDRQRSLLAEDAQDVVSALLSVESAPPNELFLALLPHRDAVLRSIAAQRGSGGSELARARQRYVAAVLGQGPGAAKRVEELSRKIDLLEARSAASAKTPERDPKDVLKRACAQLPDDAALIKFVAFDRTKRGVLGDPTVAQAALVLRGGSCDVKRISFANAKAIEDAAESFATSMRSERNDDPKARDILGQEMIAPLLPAVSGATRWLVIPDGVLWGVPLGALPDPEKKGSYLFERITIGYLTSTFELAESKSGQRVDAQKLTALLVGAPDFGSRGSGPIVLTNTGPCQLTPFEALPATAEEIADIASLLRAPHQLTGAQVTKAGIRAALTRKPWLLHFATHAYFAGQGGCGRQQEAAAGWRQGEEPVTPNPLLLSGIVLAGANQPTRVGSEAQGGILTAYEVSGLDLGSAGLVVLSACDTGTGLKLRGQEVQGLRWGFRAAGARALVTSLWRSNDVATRRLMKAFYEALFSGDIPRDAFQGPEALRRAQLAQVQMEQLLGMQRPLTWANFVFSGVL